ncbi:MAG: hypothetical protein R3E12_11415 [Candidatus Eisenbacteria bacterium]|uniref:DinB-like domain-containing protein n=1 Tax=Eiseniibacteriota bacterium TaxID=2212470 RepID=A0A956M341_UNCEI|nr:hypothetical protein [Candidatus Eisenbacteria bacterium]
MGETIPRYATQSLIQVLEETFDNHHGIFLDRGTSLFATLDQTSAEEASRLASSSCASVAQHVKHVAFYLDVMRRYLAGEELGQIDWRAIWHESPNVTGAEWDALRADVRARYTDLRNRLPEETAWSDPLQFDTPLAVAMHTAAHLGAIRQTLRMLRD